MPTDPRLITLAPTVAADGQIYDLHEDGLTPKGQLRRFLLIMGPTLDEAKGLVDAWQNMLDINKTDSDFLPLMAPLVGVDFNREIPVDQAREEVKRAVQGYKLKGTAAGIAVQAYKVTRLQTEVVEFVKNVRTANREYCFSAEFSGEAAIKFGLPGDRTAYSYDYDNVDTLVRGRESQGPGPEVVGHEAWRALDDIEASSWQAASAAPGWWRYHYATAMLPLIINLKAGPGVKDFTLQWSDNGADWITAQSYHHGDVVANTQFLGLATGGVQQLGPRNTPVDPSTLKVYQATGYSGVETTLQDNAVLGDDALAVADVTNLLAGDWVELHDGSRYGYYKIVRIEGGRLLTSAPVGELEGWAAGVTVKVVTTALKVGWTLDSLTGVLSFSAGQLTAGQRVFAYSDYLADSEALETWQTYDVNPLALVAHAWWRVLVTSTWAGNPEINELELLPDQAIVRFYRPERIGIFFTLGTPVRGCGVEMVCNRPIDQTIIAKMCRTMAQTLPAGTTPVMVFLDCHYPEVVSGGFNAWDRIAWHGVYGDDGLFDHL